MATMKKAQAGAKMVKTAKEKQNLKDATQNKNMRPTAPKTGTVKTTMGTAKSGASIKKAQGGSYITTKSGRVGRTYGEMSPYESIDTTGYSKGKKEFNLDSSLSGSGAKSSSKIKRQDVPAKIKEFKKGATKKVNLKSGGKMKTCKGGC